MDRFIARLGRSPVSESVALSVYLAEKRCTFYCTKPALEVYIQQEKLNKIN